jgi:hypothetical protein
MLARSLRRAIAVLLLHNAAKLLAKIDYEDLALSTRLTIRDIGERMDLEMNHD